ncbi:hypothetical protein IGI04_025897 [Brassica rapa subsp. trilocularis]|uniref:Endonuclease/exonuclease/phosphatase domain-containing protein n=1 Tax=Brassica rapa subsp. trilocularis TaxID=1813537 RepID=A0ABQ7KX57_BRACM|nr:hypothetical protein IGI04_025897 [Brassica rapa subsp. trilocularis]
MCFFAWNVRGLNSERRHTMTKDWINIHRPFFGAFLETHILENNKERILGAIPRGWNFYGNYGDNDSGRIVIVWDPRVTLVVYDASAQSVTCGITILSERISFTVTFVYGFNLVEERSSLWAKLVDLQGSTPLSVHPWCVLGDFNQMLRSSHHSKHLSSRIDDAGMEEANLGLQDAQLFEAQAKGLPYTWRNCQDDNPISTKIDHAFINQSWSSSFPDSFSDFLDPSQSDHAPCLFRMPAMRSQIIKPFKFFHHVIDHPEYADTVTDAWNCRLITGTNQFKLVRSLKLLKRPLRRLNKRHFSGISQRVKAKKLKVDELQRRLLTIPDEPTAREEHLERDKLNILLKAEEKYYRQRSRVRWADVGDRNTPFYHRTVCQHATRNHIHFLKDANDNFLYGLQGPHAPRIAAILKLLNQVIIYNLWREQNARIFRDTSKTPEAFFKVVDRGMRDRLLSLSSAASPPPPPPPPPHPSLLELYFWFVSPYNKAEAQEGEMVGKEPEVEKKREPEPEFEKQKEKKHTTLKEKEMENTAYKDFETAINKRDTETGRGEAFKEGGC